MKDLQNIKDEYATGDNFYNWDDLFACCAMYDYGRLEWAIDQVAIRYANEQKQELLEMLIDIVEKQYNSKYTLADLNGEISNAIELIKSATEG